ncbi:phosphohydrolase [Pseudogemmobacter faecipullorum]|uniref:GTP pyrophosphokinase n=1 Tax=Pseudogemmobacter faecipullorum TaxID=2755041 RepID=A0ABS8CQ37_9RHOB|nr:phosphohydrolase [Pseudogemmobacter faecipullorum]MCB5411505.1 GTP pyrophosphokinase [Pseudogemmobacter faecipullorum]
MQLDRAIQIAATAHAGQMDRGGQPYILHPLRVMLGASTADERVVAVLHDVVEDSDWTLEQLRAEGLTDAQASGLQAVTKRDGEDYPDFIDRAGRDPLGRAVKILDLRDNCDLTRIKELSSRDLERLEKYQRALAQLAA